MAMPEGGDGGGGNGGGGGGGGGGSSSSENDIGGETRRSLRRLFVSSHPPPLPPLSTSSSGGGGGERGDAATASASSSSNKNRPSSSSTSTSTSTSLQQQLLLPRPSSSASLHSDASSSSSTTTASGVLRGRGASSSSSKKKPPYPPPSSTTTTAGSFFFRTTTRRCVVGALLALAVALSALDFLGFVRDVSKDEGGAVVPVGRIANRFGSNNNNNNKDEGGRGAGGGFRGSGGNQKKNVTSLAEGPPPSIGAAVVVVVDEENATGASDDDDEDDGLKALEEDAGAKTAASSASSSGTADTSPVEDDGDEEEDGDDDNDQETDHGGDEAPNQGTGNRTAEDGDGEAAQGTSDGGGGGQEEDKTIPPAPAQLLYNQTYTNWTLLLSQLPVSPSRFVNEVPRGMRVAFVGDSVTRYQVLSFMYFLYTNGHWFPDDGSIRPNVVAMNEKDYGRKWNTFLNMSSYQLGEKTGHHWCDCYRGVTAPNKIFENRYFRDAQNDNYVYFVTKLGSAEARGRWWPSKINQWKHPMSFKVQDGKATWSYQWDGLIRNHLANLRPRPTHVVFNEGLWTGLNNATFKIIRKALEDVNMTGIYKTTTKRSREQTPELKDHDRVGCEMFECLDVSWSHVLVMWPYYFDYGTHFTSTVYTLFNQQLLKLLKDLGAYNGSTPAPP